MIDYSKIKIGDKVKVVGVGAPGYANMGEVLTITSVTGNRVDTVRESGETAYFALTCGAARLELV
jgi:hypothetical protein